jgi:hypothetical protein
MMHGGGKSDEAIVAVKPANKAERSAAELVERRAKAKGNAGQHSTYWAQNRSRVSQALVRIRRRFAVGPEVGAVCGKAARTDLCGGRPVMGVPTATEAKSGAVHLVPDYAGASSGLLFLRPASVGRANPTASRALFYNIERY